MIVNEIFGPTIQGEGPDIGRPCVFLRLYGCPVHCTWCDTSYTWKPGTAKTEAHRWKTGDLAKALRERCRTLHVPRLVISGGEPMAQQDAIRVLLGDCPFLEAVEIETSGVVKVSESFLVAMTWSRPTGIYFNVSPKLKHAGARVPYDVGTLSHYREIGGRFKFVVASVGDFEEVDDIVRACAIPADRVWIMPLGTNRHDLMVRSQDIVDTTIARGYNLTTRLHILLWGDKRGV